MNVGLLCQIRAAGLTVRLTEAGTVRVKGDQARVDQWLPTLRAHKAEVVAELVAEARPLPGCLPKDDERTVRRWLAQIGEHDPQTIAEVLTACRRDIEARAFFLRRASVALP